MRRVTPGSDSSSAEMMNLFASFSMGPTKEGLQWPFPRQPLHVLS